MPSADFSYKLCEFYVLHLNFNRHISSSPKLRLTVAVNAAAWQMNEARKVGAVMPETLCKHLLHNCTLRPRFG